VHEIRKILGLSPSMFQHYRNADNGKPWGVTYQNTISIDGSHIPIKVPNIIKGVSEKGENPYFQVTTPTVLQVVQNHFDCQRINGARLDNHPSSRDCFSSYFDERFNFGKDFTLLKDRTRQAFAFTPLTLALLQDSSWYKANFTMVSVNPFGHGAGCEFVESSCLNDGKVPDYLKGFFCSVPPTSESDYPTVCNYSYNMKASCDLDTSSTLGEDFRSNYVNVDFCPIKSSNKISCADMN